MGMGCIHRFQEALQPNVKEGVVKPDIATQRSDDYIGALSLNAKPSSSAHGCFRSRVLDS
jgi:hypothetical protein